MSLQISPLDLGVILLYLVGVVGIGCYAGAHRKRMTGEGSHYFLAGNTLRWPVIGLAMFAANISTIHLVGFAETAYKYGMVYGNFEWMAGFILILLSLFFAPLYLRSRVATLPDFLERRYNRHCRDWLTVVSIFSAIVIHIGVALWTAAIVLEGILKIPAGMLILGLTPKMFFVALLGVLTGVYTMIGGLLAVVWTESIQTILLLIGAVCITLVGYHYVGGWDALKTTLATHPHPLAAAPKEIACNWSTANFLSICRGPDDPSEMPWLGVLLGYPVIGIWYWCCDQTIVQRVLAAKDDRNARLGPLFCAFLKILPVFLFVLPGVICVALVQQHCPLFGGQAPDKAENTYTFMIIHMLPVGLKGLVTAAMLAAAMQTCSAALNSTATLFAYDIVARYRPQTSDHRLVLVGKITTVVGTALAIASSPIFGHEKTIYDALNDIICYVAPPITAVFLFGVFWRKASGKAAFFSLAVGNLLGVAVFFVTMFKEQTGWTKVLDWHKRVTGGIGLNSMMAAFYLLVLCSLILVVGSYLFPEPLKEEARPLVWDNWLEPLRGQAVGWKAGSYRRVAAFVLAAFVILYIVFR